MTSDFRVRGGLISKFGVAIFDSTLPPVTGPLDPAPNEFGPRPCSEHHISDHLARIGKGAIIHGNVFTLRDGASSHILLT
eukprot:8834700-Pyramimonas_sp.AAC.1